MSELGRLWLARCVVEQGWPVARAAERFQVSRTTANRWAQRYREQGPAGMADRSSRPHHSPDAPRRRWSARSSTCAGPSGWGRPRSPPGSAWPPRPCMPSWFAAASAACAIWTGPPASRSAAMSTPSRRPGPHRHQAAGQHPGGGGHRFLGRAAGKTNSQADRSSGQRRRHRHPLIGHGFIHAAVDDHSWLAYAEIHPDQTSHTAAGFLLRAQAWFVDRGVVIQRVLTDNGSCYRSHQWTAACRQLGSPPSEPDPIGPRPTARSNGSTAPSWRAGRIGGCMPVKPPAGPPSRPGCTGINHHRPHSALGGHPPITRCTNLPEPYS